MGSAMIRPKRAIGRLIGVFALPSDKWGRDPRAIPSLGRRFAVVTTKCAPLDFLPLRAFRIENEEQQDEVESNETDSESIHGRFNAGEARHVPSAAMKSQRRATTPEMGYRRRSAMPIPMPMTTWARATARPAGNFSCN
jgi:hypothetical protein